MVYFSRMSPSSLFHGSETTYVTSEQDSAHRLKMLGRAQLLVYQLLREYDIIIRPLLADRSTRHIQNKLELTYCFREKGRG